ncbi:hypothetical protein SAMN06266787_11918 [Halorubrum ezzemoulense]|uniref:Uncharacterized protein n=1 Tax=Halorubrum ezzemoulense TaxID=337243 RepID=A0A238YW62_HALEZ|nr:hypothetical protein SAMN06266787_11918 [Halorubrum ezzemoulense]
MSEVVYVIRIFTSNILGLKNALTVTVRTILSDVVFPVHPCGFLPTPLYCLEDKLWSCRPSSL